MIESTSYLDSSKKGELAPIMTLGGFVNPEVDEWYLGEMIDITIKAKEQFSGNMEHNAVS